MGAPAAACAPAAYPQNLPAAACAPSAEAECAEKPSPQGGLPTAFQALVKEAPSARRAELEVLVRALQEVLSQAKTEDTKDLLCSLLEDFYYDLKSKGWHPRRVASRVQHWHVCASHVRVHEK